MDTTARVIAVVAAIIEDTDRFLLTRRQAGVHLAGLWEFPGGKIDPGETPTGALQRELREELDVEVEPGEPLFNTRHAYPDRTVELTFYRCTLRGNPRPLLGQEMRWVPRSELASLGFPPADTELIALLTREEDR
ncbi:MAG: 8-oxo-dGTP diphosphatase MutT [Acidobacteria bacterium]|nr:8-oxo-dGTP diphosphatase MutT [Acidobacteriota bacterium]